MPEWQLYVKGEKVMKKTKKKINRTSRIELRCTEEEKKMLIEYAQKGRTTISNYILSRAMEDLDNAKGIKELITDKIEALNIANEIYHLVTRNGDEKLKMQVKELMSQIGVDELGESY